MLNVKAFITIPMKTQQPDLQKRRFITGPYWIKIPITARLHLLKQ